MQKLFIPGHLDTWQITIKFNKHNSVTSTGEPVPGAEVIITSAPDDDSIKLVPPEDDILAVPGHSVTYTFVRS